MNAHADPGILMQERSDALLGMYQENRAHARHHESMRVTVSSIIIASSVGLVSLISGGGLTRADWPLTLSLIIIGLYGTMFTAAQFERIRLYKRRANEYRAALDELLFKGPDAECQASYTLAGIVYKASSDHREQFRLLCRVGEVKSFWILWPLTITLIGTISTLYALCVL